VTSSNKLIKRPKTARERDKPAKAEQIAPQSTVSYAKLDIQECNNRTTMMSSKVLMHQVMQAEGLIQRTMLRPETTLSNIKDRRMSIQLGHNRKLKRAFRILVSIVQTPIPFCKWHLENKSGAQNAVFGLILCQLNSLNQYW